MTATTPEKRIWDRKLRLYWPSAEDLERSRKKLMPLFDKMIKEGRAD